MSGLQVSFEFFPPKTPEMEENLWRAIKRLEPLAPRFVSVTYGAGGSTRERTHRTVKRILTETPLVPAAHLTCVAATCAEVDQVARDYWDAGVRHIVALRGDPPAGGVYEPPADGYRYAADLVTGLKAVGDFEITVACFPEGHPESTSPHLDLDHLKRKIDAGATRAITQFFFDNDHYFRFLDKVRRRGIFCEIVPGIMPVTNFRTMVGFAEKAGASVPRWLGQRFDGLDDDVETRRLVAATTVAEQVQGLAEQGVREFHFYTLNRADLSFAICHILGIRPKKAAVEASS
ncbi:MAG TPA: methylenetetrahydrofolate reductase [NAD(P)H] [Gemmatimonadales bacterium]|nr:methylenetetrahydrofolate reductase [NAD(P)H] [Gemmatimonadales bacterium]